MLAALGQDVSGQLALMESSLYLLLQTRNLILLCVGWERLKKAKASYHRQAGPVLLKFMLSKHRFLDPTARDSDSAAEILPTSISNECPGDANVAGPWNQHWPRSLISENLHW